MEKVKGIRPTFVGALEIENAECTMHNAQCAISPMRDRLIASPPEQAGWFVGPEGDFTKEELGMLLGAGVIPVSLGERILRTETAAIFGVVMMNGLWK